MTDLTKLTLLAAKKGLEEKKFSSGELLEDCIKNIEKNRNLNAYIYIYLANLYFYLILHHLFHIYFLK